MTNDKPFYCYSIWQVTVNVIGCSEEKERARELVFFLLQLSA